MLQEEEKIACIQKVEILGLWDKFDIEWNLHPDVNILAGGNGSGKTTVLDCMYELLKEGTISRKKILVRLKVFFEQDIFFAYDFIDKIEEVYSNYVLGLPLIFSDNFIDISFIKTIDYQLIAYESIQKLSDDQVKTELDWKIYQLQKEYLDYQLNLSKRKDRILEKSNNPKEEIEQLNYPHKRFRAILDELFVETNKKINQEKNEISFLLDHEKPIETHQLSSGEKQILMILLMTLVQDRKPALMFMDEPEISLHIDWQKKLIGFIRELNPNIQLIIATHSPDIIMEGWLDRVFEMNDIMKPKSDSK